VVRYPVGWVASGNRANSLTNRLIHSTVADRCNVILPRRVRSDPRLTVCCKTVDALHKST